MMRSSFGTGRVIAALLSVVVLVGACSSDTSSAESDTPVASERPGDPSEIRLGLAVQSLERSFFTGMQDGSLAAAEAHDIELTVVSGNDDHATQMTAVEDLLPQIDALLLSPVDSEQSERIVERARAAGVAVVVVANQVGAVDQHGPQYVHPDTVALVTNDDISMGRRAGAFVAVQQLDQPVRIAVLSGARGTANVAMRLEGFEAELDALGIDYTIVADEDGAWNADGGHAACEAFLGADVDLIFSMSDAMTIGCVDALDGTEFAATPIVSIGGNAAGIELLEQGRIVGSVCQKPADMGALAVEVAVTSIMEGNPSLGLQFYETPLVTVDTLEQCLPQW